AHTAVKIDPKCESAVIHVNDASRAVGVVSTLLSDKSGQYKIDLKTDYADFREKFLERQVEKAYVSLDEARKNKFKIDWTLESILPPRKLGVQLIEGQDLSGIAEFIEWSPFYRSWELHGKYPEILDDEVVGREATEHF